MAGGYIAKPFIGMAGGLLPAASTGASGAAAAPRLGMLARFGAVLKPLGAIGGLLSIKFLAIGAAVAVVAGLVYKYWEPIKAFLIGVWAGFTDALQPVIAMVAPFFLQLAEWIAPVVQWFKDLFVPVEMNAAGRAVGRVIGVLIANIAQFVAGLVALPFRIASGAAALGSALVDAIVEGVTSAGPKLVDAIWALLGKVRDLLPFSDAKRSPLSRLTAAGSAFVETMGLGVLRAGSAALEQPLTRALGTAAATLQPAAALPAGPTTGISINQLIINQQPGEDAEALADKFLREIDQRRLLSQREALYDDL